MLGLISVWLIFWGLALGLDLHFEPLEGGFSGFRVLSGVFIAVPLAIAAAWLVRQRIGYD